jgi:hypothetical protein
VLGFTPQYPPTKGIPDYVAYLEGKPVEGKSA